MRTSSHTATLNISLSDVVHQNQRTAIVICDRKLHIQYVNAAAEVLFGHSAQKLCGEYLGELFEKSEDTRHQAAPTLLDQITQSVSTQIPFTMRECEFNIESRLAAAGRQDMAVDCVVIPNENESESWGALIEFTQVESVNRHPRSQGWDERREINRAMIQGIAHEVKNPLGGIKGAAQLLNRALTNEGSTAPEMPATELSEYATVIVREVDRLTRLVDRMAGPNTPYEIGAVNIHEVLEHVRMLVSGECGDSIEYHCDYDPSLPAVCGDREQLIQGALNIARNAIQAMSRMTVQAIDRVNSQVNGGEVNCKGGRLVVRTRVASQVTIGQTRHRQVVKVDFIDNGPGIPDALRESLFYPMVTGRADGSGLGLPITQEIIGRMSGLIEFESEPGNTRFSFYLPFHGV